MVIQTFPLYKIQHAVKYAAASIRRKQVFSKVGRIMRDGEAHMLYEDLMGIVEEALTVGSTCGIYCSGWRVLGDHQHA